MLYIDMECFNKKRRLRTRWRECLLPWERLGFPPQKLDEMFGEKEVWAAATRPRISGGSWKDGKKIPSF